MSKTLIILTFTMLFFGSALELINPEIFEKIDSKTQARQINSGSTNMDILLREGMGLMEVERRQLWLKLLVQKRKLPGMRMLFKI